MLAGLQWPMGLVTWIAVAVIVLVAIGLGAGVFFSGLFRGAQIVGQNPAVQNATQETKQFVEDKTQTSSNSLVITTDKAIYSMGEPVTITAKNVGSEKLSFPDSALGLEIQNMDTGGRYSVAAAQVITELGEGESKMTAWSQEGSKPGSYTATVHTTPDEGISAQVSFEIK
jgi:archaellum component FlaF (FlaF/FlaG flagellin family)